jgi:hypothetical protein
MLGGRRVQKGVVMSKLERITTVVGAYDRRHPNPAKNYGIHGMELRFVLKGERGAVQFVYYTPIHLEHVADEMLARACAESRLPIDRLKKVSAPDARGIAETIKALSLPSSAPKYNPFRGMGADIGYHALEPQYEGQEPRECDLFGKCYYDGSSLQAMEFGPKFLKGGSKVVWKMLEKKYKEMFKRYKEASK